MYSILFIKGLGQPSGKRWRSGSETTFRNSAVFLWVGLSPAGGGIGFHHSIRRMKIVHSTRPSFKGQNPTNRVNEFPFNHYRCEVLDNDFCVLFFIRCWTFDVRLSTQVSYEICVRRTAPLGSRPTSPRRSPICRFQFLAVTPIHPSRFASRWPAPAQRCPPGVPGS